MANTPATIGTEARSGPEKRAMKIAAEPHFLMKASPAGMRLRVLRQRPHVIDAVFELEADPVGQPVAERRAERAGDHDRPEAQPARADQRAEPHQHAPGRDQQRNKRQRLGKAQHEHDRRGPDLMVADIVDDRLDILFEIHETFLTSGRSRPKATQPGPFVYRGPPRFSQYPEPGWWGARRRHEASHAARWPLPWHIRRLTDSPPLPSP